MNWLVFLLDLALIGLLVTGIFYAVRLTRQLAGMRASRTEMERFVLDFSTTVVRAENGVKNLKATARSSGDDLEKLIENAHSLRDELHFLVESADQMANRLSDTARETRSVKPPEKKAGASIKPETMRKRTSNLSSGQKKPIETPVLSSFSTTSAAEKDLMRALKKIG